MADGYAAPGGFGPGFQPGGFQGVQSPGQDDPTRLLQQIAQAVTALAGEYVLPPIFDRRVGILGLSTATGPGGPFFFVDGAQVKARYVTIQCIAGSLDVLWGGDRSGDTASLCNLRLTDLMPAITIPIPPGISVSFTLRNNSTTTTAQFSVIWSS